MNIDNFPFNDLIKEVKEKKEDRRLALLKKVLMFMHKEKKDKKEDKIESIEIDRDIKRIVKAYQSVGELEGYTITNFICGPLMYEVRYWRLSFKDGGKIMSIEMVNDKNSVIRIEVR